MAGFRERIGNVFLGRRNEEGQREGGLAEAFRGGNGQGMSNPISAIGDRIGRNVAGRVNDWRTERLENRHRQDMIDAESRGRPVMAQQKPAPDRGDRLSIPGRVPMPAIGRSPIERNDTTRKLPTVNGRQMTQDEYDRYRADPRSIMHADARDRGRLNPMDPIDRGPVSQFRDATAPTRAGGGLNAARERAMEAIAARGINANRID